MPSDRKQAMPFDREPPRPPALFPRRPRLPALVTRRPRSPALIVPGPRPARIRAGGALVLLCALGLAGPARAYEQRSNTLSFGFQGGAGLLIGSSGAYRWQSDTGTSTYYSYPNYSYGDNFEFLKFWQNNWGTGLGVRIRYSLDPEHAIGASFEDLRFPRRDGLSTDIPKQYQVNNYMADYYVYFQRRQKTCPYAVIGIGFHRDAFRDTDQAVFVPESFVTNLGLGVEYFIQAVCSIDGVVRTYYLQGRGGNAISSQIQLGFQYYLLH